MKDPYRPQDLKKSTFFRILTVHVRKILKTYFFWILRLRPQDHTFFRILIVPQNLKTLIVRKILRIFTVRKIDPGRPQDSKKVDPQDDKKKYGATGTDQSHFKLLQAIFSNSAKFCFLFSV